MNRHDLAEVIRRETHSGRPWDSNSIADAILVKFPFLINLKGLTQDHLDILQSAKAVYPNHQHFLDELLNILENKEIFDELDAILERTDVQYRKANGISMRENSNLTPAQRGDELCLNCKNQWDDHKTQQLNCPYPNSDKYFVSSGRVAAPRGDTHIHNHSTTGFAYMSKPPVGPPARRG